MGDCAFDNVAMVESDCELPRREDRSCGSYNAAEASNSSHRADSLLPLRPVMKRQKSIILPQQEDDKDQSTSLFRE